MSYQNVIQTIKKKFPGSIEKEGQNGGQREITLAHSEFLETMRTLHDNDDLPYDLLIDILGIDRTPATPRFDLVYVLMSTQDFSRLLVRLKVEEGEEVGGDVDG